MSKKSRTSVDHYNRVFILGGKTLTEEDFKEHFEPFGVITDIRILKDSVTRENKGIFYITYEKASEAALAIEKMNGEFIAGLSKPIKVVLANDRSEGNVRDPNEDEKMKRLFIIVPDGHTEDDLRSYFGAYGTIEYVKMLKKNEKGLQLAYIKFNSAYHAALALEGCDDEYKPKFAETSWNAKRMKQDDAVRGSFDTPSYKRSRIDYEDDGGYRGREDRYRESDRGYEANCMLFAKMAPRLTSLQVYSLFDLLPGLATCDYNPQTGTVRARYINPSHTERARDKLKSFEYPPGSPILIQFADSGRGSENLEASMSSHFDAQNNFRTLVHAIEKATAFLQNSGLAGLGGMPLMTPSFGGEGLYPVASVAYTNAMLPPPKPLAPMDSFTTTQLHFSFSPDAVPMHIIKDMFCRFGNFVKADYIPGKNSGIAMFASSESAQHAHSALNEQTICGNHLRLGLSESAVASMGQDVWGASPYLLDRQAHARAYKND